MDAHCATKTLLIQLCPEFEECLITGPDLLIDMFMEEEGVRFTRIGEMLRKCKFV